jgi:RNA polymerase sigma-70 factor (ECF subfamily)
MLPLCLRGNAEAWKAFAEHFTPVIHAAVVRALSRDRGPPSAQDGEDVVQEVFVRLVDRQARLLRNHDPARSSLATWLGLIARSAAIDHLRRRRSESRSDAAGKDRTPREPDSAPGTEMPERLLSPRQRLVLRLLFDEGLSVAETARFLGVEPQTVRSTKHKAVERLRRHLDA